jgi:hypothetical protein
MVLNCPTCDARWPVGANVGDFERQNLEQAACPHCGKHTLRCVAVPHKPGRRNRPVAMPNLIARR